MSKIVDIRANINYTKTKEGVMVKNTELIFLSVVPDYKLIENNIIQKGYKVNESRFELTEKEFNVLISSLTELKDITENDLK